MVAETPRILDRRELIWGVDRAWCLLSLSSAGLFVLAFDWYAMAFLLFFVLWCLGLLITPLDQQFLINWLLANRPFQRKYYEPFK